MFELTYIGHAGWLVTNNDFKAVFDPWLSPYGAFFNSWHQFPENSHMLTDDLFKDLDFLYISHIHEDHCDRWTLEKINKSTLVIIPNFRDKSLKTVLQDVGFTNIKELKEKNNLKIKNVDIELIIEDGFNDRDSAIVIKDDANKIINLNDCHPSFAKVKKYSDRVDLLLLQASSAIWWPCVYGYDKVTMLKNCQLKKKNVLQRAYQYGECINPQFIVPNAGPPLFLQESLSFWDDTRQEKFNPFPLHDEISSFLNSKKNPSLFVIPGSKIQLDGKKINVITNIEERDKIYNNFHSYLQAKRLEKTSKGYLKTYITPHNEHEAVPQKFHSYIKNIKKNSKIFIKKIDFPILIEFEGLSSWIIDFSLDINNCFKRYVNQEYDYSFRFDPHIVSLLLRNKSVDFDEYFLSMKFSCSRKKDQFNEFLFAMFKNFDIKRFKLTEAMYLTDTMNKNNNHDTFIMEVDGKKKKVQKYCPHMHVDLEKCGILDKNNKLSCPLHGWKFDLKTGHCETSANHRLLVEDISDE